MTIQSNIHMHCSLCDGEDTPEQMILAATKLGFTDLGFSSHAPTIFDPTCPGLKNEAKYIQEIHGLREKYREKLNILCGIEQDTLAPAELSTYDYRIGSNHFLPLQMGENLSQAVAVDGEIHKLVLAIEQRYANNAIDMTREYYTLLRQGIQNEHPDVVGHFDLVKKYNKKLNFFDEESREYKNIALEAFDEVIAIISEYGGLFEVNTGAIARGLRDDPYPSMFLLRHAAQKKAVPIITSDSHSASTLNAYFDETQQRLSAAGFRYMAVLLEGEFTQVRIY